MRSLSWAGVGASKTSWIDSAAPKVARMRLTNRVASRECPPRAKKSSWTDTEVTSSRSAKRPHRICSCGAPPAGSVPAAGDVGSARRSSLPLAVSGSRSRVMNADGTICRGSRAAAWRRISPASRSVSSAPTRYAINRGGPEPSDCGSTAAAATAGWLVRTASTSVGSMRKPWTLTWPSARPRYSRFPSGRRRTRSPVRYIRLPTGPKGLATKRPAVSAGLRR